MRQSELYRRLINTKFVLSEQDSKSIDMTSVQPRNCVSWTDLENHLAKKHPDDPRTMAFGYISATVREIGQGRMDLRSERLSYFGIRSFIGNEYAPEIHETLQENRRVSEVRLPRPLREEPRC